MGGSQLFNFDVTIIMNFPGPPPFPSLASFFLPQCRQQLVPRELLTHLCLWTYPAEPALCLKACLLPGGVS